MYFVDCKNFTVLFMVTDVNALSILCTCGASWKVLMVRWLWIHIVTKPGKISGPNYWFQGYRVLRAVAPKLRDLHDLQQVCRINPRCYAILVFQKHKLTISGLIWSSPSTHKSSIYFREYSVPSCVHCNYTENVLESQWWRYSLDSSWFW